MPESGGYLIQGANRCGFHLNRWEFESCPVGRIEVPSAEFFLDRPDRPLALEHHPCRSFPHLGRAPAWSCHDPIL